MQQVSTTRPSAYQSVNYHYSLYIIHTIDEGKVVKRFLGFVPIELHNGQYLFDVFNKMLNDNNIVIKLSFSTL